MEILSGFDILVARNVSNSSAAWLGDRYKETTHFSYWQKLQKLNIQSNTGKIYNSRTEIHENMHTQSTFLYVTRMICNRRYQVSRYRKILMNLGTIWINKLDQTFLLCCTTWEDLSFRDYVQWYNLDSSGKSRSCRSI